MSEARRLIDGGALTRTMCGKQCGCEPEECGYEVGNRCPWRNEIDKAPTIDPVRHAHWIEHKWIGFMDKLECSECGSFAPTIIGVATPFRFNYCSCCGARMDGEGEKDG